MTRARSTIADADEATPTEGDADGPVDELAEQLAVEPKGTVIDGNWRPG